MQVQAAILIGVGERQYVGLPSAIAEADMGHATRAQNRLRRPRVARPLGVPADTRARAARASPLALRRTGLLAHARRRHCLPLSLAAHVRFLLASPRAGR